MDKVLVNVVGRSIYQQRMKIEKCFRDLETLLGLEMMHKKRDHTEQMVALVLIVYAIGLILGESLRAYLFPNSHPPSTSSTLGSVLQKLKWTLPHQELNLLTRQNAHISLPSPYLSELLSELQAWALTQNKRSGIIIAQMSD